MAIGQKLEEARNRKGISIREASESTKIRGDFLTSFEAGNFEINLPEVYLRGFIRVYARFLGIDPESAVADLNLELGSARGRSTKKSIGKIGATDSADPVKDNIPDNIRTSTKGSTHLSNKRQVLLMGGIITGIIIVLLITIILIFSRDTDSNVQEIATSSTDQTSSVRETSTKLLEDTIPLSEKVNLSKSTESDSLLKLATVGPIERLIISDEGKSPKVYHEFKNLSSGWEKTINFTSSFRCYSSNLKNIRFAVNDGPEKQVSGNGPGNFSWQRDRR